MDPNTCKKMTKRRMAQLNLPASQIEELTELKANLDQLENSLESAKVMLKQDEYTVDLTKKSCEESLTKIERIHEDNMRKLERERELVTGKLACSDAWWLGDY